MTDQSSARAAVPAGLSPYVGPRPYGEADHHVFFGRDREAAEVCSLWLAARLVVLYGPAGVGKTSLLQAGVLPRIAGQGIDVDLLPVGRIIYQSAHPRAAAPSTYAYTLMSSWASAGSPPADNASVADFLRGRPAREDKYGDSLPVLGAIDHFEELYTAYPARAAERDDVIQQLADALDAEPALRLLLVVRDDHLGDLAADEPRLLPYPATRVRLLALTPEAARAAITGPALWRGREIAEADATRLVDNLRTVRYVDRLDNSIDIRHEYVEPMSLQIVCERIWSLLAKGGKQDLTGSMEVRNFDIDAALTEFYADVVRKVAQVHDYGEQQLHDWLASAFITERGTRAITYRGIVMTDGIPNEIADDLAEHGILTSEERVLGTWFQLSQGRLVRVVQRAGTPRPEPGTPDVPSAGPQPLDYRAAAVEAMARGDFTDATRLATEAVEQFRSPGDLWKRADTLALLGSVARANGDVPKSTQYYENAVTDFISIDDSRSVVRLYVTLAEMHFLAHDFTNAAYFSAQALVHASRDPDALIASGYARWYDGHPPEAVAAFNRTLGTNAALSLALSGRGQAEAEMEAGASPARLRDSTLADLDRALEIGLPSAIEEADTRSGRALALASRGRASDAQDELAAALALVPGRSQNLLRAALISERAADLSSARSYLDDAARALPPHSPWHLQLAKRLAGRLSRLR